MKSIMWKFRPVLPALAAFAVGGCLLSGTFTVDERFSFASGGPIYFYAVDVTDEEEWADHKDDIDQVDVVGFELWITNHSAGADTFAVYLDDFGEPVWGAVEQVQANAVKVFGDLAVAPGPGVTTHVTYGESLGYMTNVAEMRRLAKEGRFHFYGISFGDGDTDFTVDSVRVVVTFEAST